MENECDYLFKIIIIGDAGVGKSSLLVRFTDDIFNDSYISTIGVDFRIKTIELDGKKIKLQIWDTAGQERFRTIVSSYYRGAQGVIMVYDLTDRETFNNINNWLAEINRYGTDDVVKILVGNKCDSEKSRIISYHEAATFAKNLNMPFIETSAKDDNSIHKVFEIISSHIKMIVNKNESLVNPQGKSKDKKININSTKIEMTDNCTC